MVFLLIMISSKNYGAFDPRIKRKIQIIDVIIALVMVGFTIFSLLNYNSFETELKVGVQAFGLVGLFFITIFLEFIPQVINPLFLLLAVIAAHVNVHLAILVTVVASLIGSLVGFEVGKRFGPRYVYILFEQEQIEKTLKFWYKYGKYVVFFGALEPLPYFPIVYGALQMRWLEFILYGIIPRAIGFIVQAYLVYFGLWSLGA